jgi:(p)ppGpp synthase/HD superfamily hydrolase
VPTVHIDGAHPRLPHVTTVSPANSDGLLSDRLAAAITVATQLHGRDARKGSNTPVLTHLFAVCLLVQRDGGSEDEAIAALLHDALEDHPEQLSADALEAQFGARVRHLVELSTDTPPGFAGGVKPPWRERKERYLAHARAADPADLRVTIADKIDNLRAILADYAAVGEALWSRFNAGRNEQLWYYRATLEAYRAAGCQGALVDELARLVAQLPPDAPA